jgi:hypothetical protein
MQYVPETTAYDSSTGKYDLDEVFIGNVKSTYATDPTYEKLTYFLCPSCIERLKTYEGLLDHMNLAECRRRIYRSLPLDEFGCTLPYALS